MQEGIRYREQIYGQKGQWLTWNIYLLWSYSAALVDCAKAIYKRLEYICLLATEELNKGFFALSFVIGWSSSTKWPRSDKITITTSDSTTVPLLIDAALLYNLSDMPIALKWNFNDRCVFFTFVLRYKIIRTQVNNSHLA